MDLPGADITMFDLRALAPTSRSMGDSVRAAGSDATDEIGSGHAPRVVWQKNSDRPAGVGAAMVSGH